MRHESDTSLEFEAREQSDFWFACVDIEVIHDKSLNPCDKAIFAVICSYANVQTRQWVLKVQTIAETAGCGVRTAQKSLQALIDRGVIERTVRFENGKQQASLYRVIGHRAKCYESQAGQKDKREIMGANSAGYVENCTPMGANSAGYVENCTPMGANSAGYVENCTPMGAKSAPQLLEPESYENKTSPPSPPEGGAEDEPFELKNEPETSANREKLWQEAVIGEYNRILPELPKAEALSNSRCKAIRRCTKQDAARKEIDWWRRYFERVRECPWLLGQNPSGWRANFDWLLRDEPMQKVIEGAYTGHGEQGGRTVGDEAAQKNFTNNEGEIDARALLRNIGTSQA
ncbi:MAG: helix-turn-helix domain-containing protein [Synergistaceae bacterium]|nr:helix-turn-helix domain-containing protein [Synergistaceae bacterium]